MNLCFTAYGAQFHLKPKSIISGIVHQNASNRSLKMNSVKSKGAKGGGITTTTYRDPNCCCSTTTTREMLFQICKSKNQETISCELHEYFQEMIHMKLVGKTIH